MEKQNKFDFLLKKCYYISVKGAKMGIKVTEQIIKEINERYAACGVKAKVARELGISAGTVSKYIIKDYVPEVKRVYKRFSGEIPDIVEKDFDIPDWSVLCKYSDEERAAILELQKEILV